METTKNIIDLLNGIEIDEWPNFLHEEVDPYRVGQIAASMRDHGWVGAPIVMDGENLLTGHHRWTAAMLVGIKPEVEQLVDIVDSETYEALTYKSLPEWVREDVDSETKEKYGMDWE
jgi:ParB-like chromosome segregation protein Spo0J